MATRAMPRQGATTAGPTYQTPGDLIRAACSRLGIRRFGLDLAATKRTAQARLYFTRRDDAFSQAHWRAPLRRWGWLNPPYDKIGPWAERAYFEAHVNAAQIAMLVPASTGANWWVDWVHRKGHALMLHGRVQFVGHTTPYPKDLALVLYSPFHVAQASAQPYGIYDPWRWRDDL